MTLAFQLQQAPLGFGLAEGVDPHQTPFGTLMTAENCAWTRGGRIEKRRGYTALSMLPTGIATRLMTRGTELVALTSGGGNLAYGVASTAGAWQLRGNYPEICATTRAFRDDVRGINAGDMAVLNDGTTVYAWLSGDSSAPDGTSSGQIFFQVCDANGTTIYNTTYAGVISNPQAAGAAAARLRVLSDGTMFAIVWGTSAGIRCITGTASTTSAIITLVGSANSGQFSPLDAIITGGYLYVAYIDTGGLPALSRFNFASTPTLVNTANVGGAAVVTYYHMSIDGSASDLIHVAYMTGTTALYAAMTPALVTQVNETSINVQAAWNTFGGVIGVVRASATTAYVAWSYNHTAASSLYPTGVTRSVLVTVSGSLGSIGTRTDSSFQMLVSKPWMLNGIPYAMVASCPFGNSVIGANVGTQNGYSGGDMNVIALSSGVLTHRVAAKTETSNGGFWRTAYLCSPFVVSSTVVRTVYPSLGSIAPVNTSLVTVREQMREAKFTSDGSNAKDFLRAVDEGGESYLAGGATASYDGVEFLPVNFSHPPFLLTPTANATGGNMAAGAYVYNASFERRSAAGVLHRGPTAVATTVTTTGATGSVTLRFTPAWLSLTTSPVVENVVVYRSILAGNILQRLSYLTVQNAYNTSTSVLTGTDPNSDATGNLARQAVIYTASGELDDYQPPGALTLTEHQNRVWIVAPDGMTLWFSKDPTLNPGIAPGFNPALTMAFEVPIVALRTLDSALVAFTSSGMFSIQGDGPAPNGQGASYQAVKVQTDVGCTTPKSVVSVPDGLMFQSTRGIYLLTRGYEVQFVGAPVQSQTSGATVTSAVLVAKYGEVRFTLSTGVSLVYNYLYKQWTTAKYTVTGTYGRPIVDAVMWNGAYTFVCDNGQVCQETDAGYLDGSTYVPMTLETTWNNAAGPLAYQSVRNFSIEGISNANHDLTISVGFDNNPTYQQAKTFLAGTPVTAIGPFESCDISIGTRRKCQAIRFKIQDTTPTTLSVGTGQGPSFDAIGVEVGVKQGFRAKPLGKTG